MKRLLHRLAVVVVLGACTTTTSQNPLDQFEELTPSTMLEAPEPATSPERDPQQVGHGKYLVELLGCGTCHTSGALIGEPDFERRLAGSRVGIAFSNPLKQARPGVAYPANLTPDRETGLGDWTDAQVATAIRSGVGRYGYRHLDVMPWPAYAALSDADVADIVAYLRSLPPVRHRVPARVAPGSTATEPYVHFGVYRSRD